MSKRFLYIYRAADIGEGWLVSGREECRERGGKPQAEQISLFSSRISATSSVAISIAWYVSKDILELEWRTLSLGGTHFRIAGTAASPGFAIPLSRLVLMETSVPSSGSAVWELGDINSASSGEGTVLCCCCFQWLIWPLLVEASVSPSDA